MKDKIYKLQQQQQIEMQLSFRLNFTLKLMQCLKRCGKVDFRFKTNTRFYVIGKIICIHVLNF